MEMESAYVKDQRWLQWVSNFRNFKLLLGRLMTFVTKRIAKPEHCSIGVQVTGCSSRIPDELRSPSIFSQWVDLLLMPLS